MLVGVVVFAGVLVFFATTETSARGVNGGEDNDAVAGVYLSFQKYEDPGHNCSTLMP